MKKILIVLLIIPLSNLSLAATNNLNEMDYEFCADMSNLAKSAMKMRQLDIDIVDAIGASQTDWGKNIIIDAYTESYYYSEENQNRAISDFSTRYYLECIEHFRS